MEDGQVKGVGKSETWAVRGPHLSPRGVMASRITCMRMFCSSMARTADTAPAATMAPVAPGLSRSCRVL